ncbi:MAG TPA: hypothetical protein VNP97_13265 [Microbacterium sp.]|jgi:hypothetical protein|nr:hypothetical protein [Microbacterium sp.]
MVFDWFETTDSPSLVDDDDPLRADDLRDDADEFEDELAAEMLRTGAIEVWT